MLFSPSFYCCACISLFAMLSIFLRRCEVIKSVFSTALNLNLDPTRADAPNSRLKVGANCKPSKLPSPPAQAGGSDAFSSLTPDYLAQVIRCPPTGYVLSATSCRRTSQLPSPLPWKLPKVRLGCARLRLRPSATRLDEPPLSDEAALYDRQIRLWGLEAQQRSVVQPFRPVVMPRLII